MNWQPGKFQVFMANRLIYTLTDFNIAAGEFFEFDGDTLRLMNGSEFPMPQFRAGFDQGWFRQIQAPRTIQKESTMSTIPTIDSLPDGWMQIGDGWTLTNRDNNLDFDLALKVAKESLYQTSLVQGDQALSGSTLKGIAKKWSSRYASTRDALLESLTAAGVPWMKVTFEQGVRLVIGRNFPVGLSMPEFPVVGEPTGDVEPFVKNDMTDTVADLLLAED